MAWTKTKRLKKSLLIISFFIALSDGIFVYINYLSSQHALQEELNLLGSQLQASFTLLLDQTATTMQQIATYVASNPSVQKQFLLGKNAVSKEGGGRGGPKSAQARAGLMELVQESWEHTSRRYDTRQLHFHLGPGSTSFLRVHRPSKFGDNMDQVRFTVVDVNRYGKPTKGFETGRVYSGIRGVVPVFHMDPESRKRMLVGALEAGTSFAVILKELRKVTGADCAVFLTMDHMVKNIWPGFLAETLAVSNPVGRYVLEQTTNPLVCELAPLPRVYRMLHGQGNTVVHYQNTDYAVSIFPLRDYAGSVNPKRENVGAVVFFKPCHNLMASFKKSIWVNTSYAVLGYFFIEFCLIIAWRYGSSLLQKTIDSQTSELQESNQGLRDLITTQKLDIKTAKKILMEMESASSRNIELQDDLRLQFEGVVLSTNQEGGDHYFVHNLKPSPSHPKGATFFGLIDQSGHEVACILRNILTAHVTEKALLQGGEPSLAKRVEDINNRIASSGIFYEDEFFTAFYGQIDHQSLELEYLAAGHPPAFLCRRNQVTQLPQDGEGANVFMAFMPEWEMNSAKIALQPGDRLVIYSDGLTEATRPPLSNRELQNIVQESLQHSKGKGLSGLIHSLIAIATKHTGYKVDYSAKLNTSPDDVSVLVLELQQKAIEQKPAGDQA